jgi:hypothetical protein
MTTERIELTIKSSYLPDWKAYEGVRELVQNAKDAETEHGAQMSVKHKGSTLVLTNRGCAIPRQAFLFGHTTKADRSDTIGKFGEGFKLGILALTRAGHSVVVRTKDEIWRPCLRESALFGGEQVLVFDISKSGRETPNVEVTISGIEASVWKEMKQNFLFLVERKGDEIVDTSAGSLLMAPRFKGRIYVKGIFVQHDEAYAYGYDLKYAPVDRDRRIIGRYDLQHEMRKVWQAAMASRPDLREGFVKLLSSTAQDLGAIESWNVSYFDDETREAVAASFKARFGEDAVPAVSMDESRDVSHLGKRGVVVPGPFAAVLRSKMGTIEEVKTALKNEIVKTHSWDDLTPAEQAVYNTATDRVSSVVGAGNGATVNVVDFRGTILGLVEGDKISIARSELSRGVAHTVATLVHEFAHRISGAGDGDAAHVAEIENLWTKIYEKLTLS